MKFNAKILGYFTVSLTCTTLLNACAPSNTSSEQLITVVKDDIQTPETNVAQLKVTNPSKFGRESQAIYTSFYDLGLSNVGQHTKKLQVNNSHGIVNSQYVDQDHDGALDGLLFLTDLHAGQSLTFSIDYSNNSHSPAHSPAPSSKLTQAEISHKVGGQWVTHTKPPKHKPANEFKEYVGGHFENVNELTPPAHYTDHSNWIRYEGPGIESDKVGYRIYLDWRNGFDIFGKTTRKPALQNVGLDGYESYHHMQDWGMDILKVGSSLGAGGFGLWHDNKLSLVNNVDSWQAKILADGDLQSTVQINYKNWKNTVNNQNISVNISMNGGSRLAKVKVKLQQNLPTMAAGVVKHKNTEFIQGNTNITNKAYSYIASWGKQSLDGSYLGMAIFFQKGQLAKITEDNKNYLAILKPTGKSNQQHLDYYFAASWQPESGISTKAAFIDYLNQEAEKLTILPRIELSTRLSQQAKQGTITAKKALAWSKKLADSELNRKVFSYTYNGWDVHRKRKPKFEYDIIGLLPMSYDKLFQLTGENKYDGIIEKITGSFINEQGEIGSYTYKSFNIDSVAPGRNLLTLYRQTGEDKYRKAAALLRKQLEQQPRTAEGAFWHKKKYTNQLWLDGVYMGLPFLAEYAMMFETGDKQAHSLDEVINEFTLTRKYLRDAKTGLYYHGWDELKQQDWADKTTGLSPEFWARGMGWLAMAVVDVLDYIPEQNSEQRQALIELSQEIAADIVKVQDVDSGTWWQIMDKPNAIGNYKESSATAMYTYFLAKAINKGYISKDFQAATLKAYQGMIDQFVLVHDNGEISMTHQCYVAGLGFGRDGTYHYYMSEPIYKNDPKGNVPFIIAGIEVHHLLKN
ncbi:MAG: glycoside hydrolase family 88 protein [Colwellia sp.]|nr:glycoside hydrolase family 88 protein [Colwellia sp.]